MVMQMNNNLIIGGGLVTLVAAIKTYVVSSLLLDGASFAIQSGLFALFLALTATVAYVSYTQLKNHLMRQRQEKLAPGGSEPIAKETVIARHARDWGLSRAEADVAIFVAKGFSNSEIASMRGSAVATVKSQLGNIYQKSGLDNRYQLMAFVTDEVVTMAKTPEKPEAAEKRKPQTVDTLPLSGRMTKTAA